MTHGPRAARTPRDLTPLFAPRSVAVVGASDDPTKIGGRVLTYLKDPRFTGTVYELLSAPVSVLEVLAGYVGAAATKSVMLGTIILATARLFVPFEIQHPFIMLGFLILTSVTFSLLGFAIGIWADSWEKTSIVPTMIVTPLTFLGGSFYSLSMLPPVWQKITLFNPVVYLINGFRWSFYGKSDVNVVLSFGMTLGFMLLCLAVIHWMFRTGYKLKN